MINPTYNTKATVSLSSSFYLYKTKIHSIFIFQSLYLLINIVVT